MTYSVVYHDHIERLWRVRRFVRLAAAIAFATRESQRIRTVLSVARVHPDGRQDELVSGYDHEPRRWVAVNYTEG